LPLSEKNRVLRLEHAQKLVDDPETQRSLVFYDESPFWSLAMGQVRVTRKEGERLEEENMVARRSRAPVKINLLGCLSYEQGLVLTYSE
jgi:hypothetical protein